MIFSEGSRYNEYECNTINEANKRPADIVVETNKKEKGNCYRSAVAKRQQGKESVFCEKPEATVTFVRDLKYYTLLICFH